MSRRGRTVIVTIALFGSALFLLPALLGWQPVLHALIGAVGRQIPGTLEVSSCSLGWLQGLHCEQFLYQEPERGLRFEAPRVVSDKGLLLLLAAPSYLGEIVIDQPTFSFLPSTPGDATSQPHAKTAEGSESPGGLKSEGGDQVPWWEWLSFRLKMNGGRLILAQTDSPARTLARDIELTSNLAMGTVNYDLGFRAAAHTGQLRAKGFINLPLPGQSLLETLISRAEVEINELELTDFLDLAASRSSTFPRGKGVLNATLRLNAAGVEDLEMRGEASLQSVQLAGGVLGQDHPIIDRLNVTFNGSHRIGEGWRLSTLALQSDPIRLTATGRYDGQTVALTAKGSVLLPAVAAQLPRMLALHEKTTINEGTADFFLNIAGAPEALIFRAGCRTDRLSILHDGRAYSWDTPLDLLAEAEYAQEKTTFQTLRLHTPFFEARGSGGIDNFTLQAGGDLDQMSQELKKIFALDVHAKGRAELSAMSRKRDDGGFALESRVAIRGFALARAQAQLFPAHDFLFTSMVGAAPAFVQDGTLQSIKIDAVSWPGKIAITADDMARDAEQSHNNCTVHGAVDLERLSVLLQGMSDGVPAAVFKGQLKFEGAGEWEGQHLSLHTGNGTVERLAVAGADFAFHEPRIAFGLGSARRIDGRPVVVQELRVAENWQDLNEQQRPVFEVDFARQRMAIRHLAAASSRMTLDADGLLENWWRAVSGFSVTLRSETDGGILADIIRSTGWLPQDLTVQGRARINLAAGSGEAGGTRTDLSLHVEPFSLWRGKSKLFADPRPTLKLSLLRTGHDQDTLKITSFFLDTVPLTIEGAGLITRNTPPSLELQGQMTPDYAAAGPLFAPLVGREVVVNGNRAGDFLLSLPLAFPVKWEQLIFSARLPVDSLRILGADLRQVTLPVDLNRGKLHVEIDGTLGGGMVTAHPLWDLADPKMVMTLPSNSQLFKDVPLKPPLVDGFLSRLHPLFGILAQPQGTVDLRLDNFSLSVFEKRPQPAFTATIALDRIKFKATGVLRQILDLNGFDQQWLRCRERELTCEGKNGRVSCGPVHLLVDGTEVSLSGTLDKNGGLNYRVRLPIRKQLADRAQLVVQAEASAEAEIDGTRQHPIFDQAVFLAGLSEQVRRNIGLMEGGVGSAAEPTSEPGPVAGEPPPGQSPP